MEAARSLSLPDRVEDDNERLFEFITREFGENFTISHSDVDAFQPVMGRIFESHPTDRLIVFRPLKGTPQFGCIRIHRREAIHQDEATKDKKGSVWEEKRGKGPFVGLIPADCFVEALFVEIKFITNR